MSTLPQEMQEQEWTETPHNCKAQSYRKGRPRETTELFNSRNLFKDCRESQIKIVRLQNVPTAEKRIKSYNCNITSQFFEIQNLYNRLVNSGNVERFYAVF